MEIYVNNQSSIKKTMLEISIWGAFESSLIKVYFDAAYEFDCRYTLYVDQEHFGNFDLFIFKLSDNFYKDSCSFSINMDLQMMTVKDLTEVIYDMLSNIRRSVKNHMRYNNYLDIDIASMYPDINFYKEMFKEENTMPPKEYWFDEPSQAVKDKSRHRMIQSMEIILGIRDVKFNDPATIVFWDDGTKTVVKCQKGDKFDPEKGLAMAIVKKQCGHNNGYFNEIFKKWCPDEETLMIDFLDKTIAKESKRPTVFTETAEEYKEEVKKQKKIGDGYDDIRWEKNGRIVRK